MDAVTLIVKAPNQKIEDQTIQCELNWSIKKLKGYLSEVYPSKPSTDEQKLIYSGKLLPDTVVLKDILRRYDGQDTHTVHLVCIPKNDNFNLKIKNQKLNSSFDSTQMDSNNTHQHNSQNNNTNPGEGLRQRLNAQHVQRNQTIINNNTVASWNNFNTTASNQTMAQNLLWLNQAYTQYITQYMQMLQHGIVPEDAYLAMLQTNPINVQLPNSRNNENTEQPVQNEHDAEQAAAPPINAVGVGLPAAEDAEGERDWLDWFYITSRMMVLFSIVYFYSSPARFLIVLILGTLVHLYQIGFFRNVMAELPNENDNAPNNNVNAPNNNDIVDNNLEHNQDTPASNTQSVPTPHITINNDRPHLVTIMWTFVRAFFQSLIPETPNAI